MAASAIDLDLSQLPRAEIKPRRRRGENTGRHVSRKVRRRNQRGTNPRWQPKRAFARLRRPRAADLADALAEAFDDSAVPPEEFWKSDEPFYPELLVRADARAYETQRQLEDAAEVGEHSFAVLNRFRVEHKRRVLAQAHRPEHEVETALRLFDLELAGQYAA